MDANAIAKALRCGNTIGGSCYAACKYRENGLCELTESQLRINAATLIETIAAENVRLRAERDKAVEDITHDCDTCLHADCAWDKPPCETCIEGEVLSGIKRTDNWQWRGTEGKA